jgi:hypothetical protein
VSTQESALKVALAVVVAVALGAAVVFPEVPAPMITSAPANPTSSTTGRFSFIDRQARVSLE